MVEKSFPKYKWNFSCVLINLPLPHELINERSLRTDAIEILSHPKILSYIRETLENPFFFFNFSLESPTRDFFLEHLFHF